MRSTSCRRCVPTGRWSPSVRSRRRSAHESASSPTNTLRRLPQSPRVAISRRTTSPGSQPRRASDADSAAREQLRRQTAGYLKAEPPFGAAAQLGAGVAVAGAELPFCARLCGVFAATDLAVAAGGEAVAVGALPLLSWFAGAGIATGPVAVGVGVAAALLPLEVVVTPVAIAVVMVVTGLVAVVPDAVVLVLDTLAAVSAAAWRAAARATSSGEGGRICAVSAAALMTA